jgi:hypothetical protein
MADPNATPTIGAPKNCGHAECHCLAAPQSSYCSDVCEHAARLDAMGSCPCTHAECRKR